MAGTAITPGGTTAWNEQVWERKFEAATYQNMKLIPVIEEHERLWGILNVRKAARITGGTLSTTSDGTGLTYLNPLGTSVTLTAAANAVPVAWSDPEEHQVNLNFELLAREIEASLAELTESGVAANIASFTQALSSASITAPVLRQAVARLGGNTNGMALPGGKEQVFGFFSHTQLPALTEIPEFNAADMRGDSENPYVKGIWMKAGGVMGLISTVVYNDGTAWHNAVLHPTALGISWNKRSYVKKDQTELTNRRIGYNNLGSNVVHDLRAVPIRTTDNLA